MPWKEITSNLSQNQVQDITRKLRGHNQPYKRLEFDAPNSRPVFDRLHSKNPNVAEEKCFLKEETRTAETNFRDKGDNFKLVVREGTISNSYQIHIGCVISELDLNQSTSLFGSEKSPMPKNSNTHFFNLSILDDNGNNVFELKEGPDNKLFGYRFSPFSYSIYVGEIDDNPGVDIVLFSYSRGIVRVFSQTQN